MLPLLIAGAGAAAALLGVAIAKIRKVPMLADVGVIPTPNPTKTVVGRGGKGKDKQSAKVLRWAPKIRSAILANPEVPEDERVEFLVLSLATMHQESGGDPKATSYETEGVNNTGRQFKRDANGNKIPLAQGLGQMIKATQKQFGVKDPYNPDDMIPGMIRMFVWQRKNKFIGKDPAQAARGYYAGTKNINKGLSMADRLAQIQAMPEGKAKKKALASYNNVVQYINYRLRLLDLYGDVR